MADVVRVNSAVNRAHRKAVEIADADLVSALVGKLGTRLVSFIVSKDQSTVGRWRRPGASLPDEANRALRVTYQIFQLLEKDDSDHTIRAWFIGMNPQLDDTSPAEAISQGDYRGALAAARAFLAGG